MLMTLVGGKPYRDVEPDLHMTAMKLRIYCLGTIRRLNNADRICQSHNEKKVPFASIFQCCKWGYITTVCT